MKQDPKEVASQQKLSVVEGNKSIAEFMEWIIEPGMENDENPYYNVSYKPGNIPAMFLLNALRFHSSWDWLMSVVEKIESLGGYSFEINLNSAHVYEMDFDKSDLIIEAHENSKIASTWLAVVEFIQWYNETKK